MNNNKKNLIYIHLYTYTYIYIMSNKYIYIYIHILLDVVSRRIGTPQKERKTTPRSFWGYSEPAFFAKAKLE